MNFLLREHVKNLVCTQNYQKLTLGRQSAAFLQITGEIFAFVFAKYVKRLNLIVVANDGHIQNKISI